MPTTFDAIVIGAGQAGPPLASRLSDAGMKVAVIERGKFGGTCVNNGCVPTKTIVASAYVAQMARRASEYGVALSGGFTVDMTRVKARKDAIVERGAKGIRGWMDGLENGKVFTGHARFTGPKTIEVNGEVLQSGRIFLDVGGRPIVPDLPGLNEIPYLTNISALELTVVPEHLIVLGGSYIGLEFAQAFRRFGAKVTVVEMADRLIAREDDDVSEAVRQFLADEGIDIRLGAECLSVEKTGSGVALKLSCAEGAPRIEGSHILLAVGRRPNTDDLGLDKAGVATDARGFITVDEHCRSNVPHIFAMGDCNGRGAFTHTAYNDYEVVAANLLDQEQRKLGERISCYGLFTDPPLGRIGMTLKEVKAKGVKALTATLQMTSIGRARERGETKGFMRLIVDAQSERILGASILGVGGDEVVQTLLLAMAADVPYHVIARTMFIHPTVSEYLPTLVGNLEPVT